MRGDTDGLSIGDVKQCKNCKAFHTDDNQGRWVAEVCKTFDPQRPCKLCGEPVIGLSFGGPEICPPCDVGPEKDKQ